MLNQNLNKSIRHMRWFMGKNRPIYAIHEFDSVEIGNNRLIILDVSFVDGDFEKYVVLEDEKLIGTFLDNAFTGNSLQNIFAGKQGYFLFSSRKKLSQGCLQNIKPIVGEQSNSAFFVPGYFFKLYRRLQPGIHPEPEILRNFSEINSNISPEFCGECVYKTNDGKIFSIGILEKFIPNTINAWDVFCNKMDINKAFELGKTTLEMHKVLRNLRGTNEKEEPPFEKLEQLLRENNKEEAFKLLKILPKLQKKYEQFITHSKSQETKILAPQRIHGDFHLGQVLSLSENNGIEKDVFKIIDFEGEPSRTLDYRRGLHSPAVDIAGMLRSFHYAKAISKLDCKDVEEAFLKGYAQAARIPLERLKIESAPYILSKAIYEACYELEFRPSWFHIPATALLNSIE